MAEGSKMKTWHKVAIGIVTIGVTGTIIYFGVKALKNKIKAKQAKETEPAVTVEPDKTKDKPVDTNANTKMDTPDQNKGLNKSQ